MLTTLPHPREVIRAGTMRALAEMAVERLGHEASRLVSLGMKGGLSDAEAREAVASAFAKEAQEAR